MAYEQLVSEILAGVGGKGNIDRATHYATRLRLVLKDKKLVDKEKIDGLEKVAGSVFSGGQYQIIIGMSVPEVHKEFIAAMGSPEVHEEVKKEKETNLFNRFFKAIVGIMKPTFGVMGAAGILKGLLALALATNALSEADGAYQVWHAMSEAFFYFFPIWVGFNASKVFGGSQFIGAALGAALVYPGIIELQTAGYSFDLSDYGSSCLLGNWFGYDLDFKWFSNSCYVHL